jgi:hypothetical protein
MSAWIMASHLAVGLVLLAAMAFVLTLIAAAIAWAVDRINNL